MSDPTSAPAESNASAEISAELTRSLTAIWQHNAGAKPSATNAEVSSEKVKFVLNDCVAGEPHEPVAEGDDPRSTETAHYRTEAIAAVTRITGRKVLGYIPKRDAKTDVATDTYLLEPSRVKR
jgi:hypothetical protein